jgi:hypothetical protein
MHQLPRQRLIALRAVVAVGKVMIRKVVALADDAPLVLSALVQNSIKRLSVSAE